jgi:hypothetical protein
MMKRLLMSLMLLMPFGSGGLLAQQETLRERMLGTWHFVIAEITAPDG